MGLMVIIVIISLPLPVFIFICMAYIDAANQNVIAWHSGFVPISNVLFPLILRQSLPDHCAT